jgi:methylenetetrahydrofolate dehydrogenase (NADP+) / methenyltetrahydrofolate cyclohydrolase
LIKNPCLSFLKRYLQRMSTDSKIIDGKLLADEVLSEIRAKMAAIESDAPKPAITFVRVGEDPASRSYVARKQRVANELGFLSDIQVFPETITESKLIEHIASLNANPNVHGILVQAPLPAPLRTQSIFGAVDPRKDVDGFNPINLGKLVTEDSSGFVPCTPLGLVEICKRENIQTEGRHLVIVGRGLIVGKPASILFVQKQLSATVTVCHSKTQNLQNITRQADILIAATGLAGLITAQHVKQDAVVLDVGINRQGENLVGDVDFESVYPIVSRITPVPGGVGPLTVAMLMVNTFKAYLLALKI